MNERGWRWARELAVSGGVHGLLLAALLAPRRVATIAVTHPGTARGSRITLTYSPGHSATQSSVAVSHAAPVHSRAVRSADTQRPLTASLATASSAAPDATSGGDARGNGNVTVALATYFPWPRPDLAELAHGTRGDVVVEVTIDANGRITESRLAQGLGPAIDEDVMRTIQAWVFKPATKDGLPVASEQELLFHYERG